MYLGKYDNVFHFVNEQIKIQHIPLARIDGYQDETIVQVARLYAACLNLQDDDYIMTGDVDMIPLSDYWKPDYNVLTVWGHDLTEHNHYPICYIGAPRKEWKRIMMLESNWELLENMTDDLNVLPNARTESDPVKRWVVDQDLITHRIGRYKGIVNSVPRGTLPSGYPIGRVDRSSWTLNHPVLIDCHLMRGIYDHHDSLVKTMELLAKAFPEYSFDWFINYTRDFAQLLK